MIVISGDTCPSDNLIRDAKGADILIHEAPLPVYFDQHDTPEVAARLKAYHTSAEDAGKVAQSAGVKMLVLTHLDPGNNDKAFLDLARKYFKGKIVVGHDLMRFDPLLLAMVPISILSTKLIAGTGSCIAENSWYSKKRLQMQEGRSENVKACIQ